MPCCGSVGGCGARAVSRKTPIYFIDNYQLLIIIDGNDSLEQVVGQALGPEVADQMERATQSVKNIADV